MHRFCYVWSEKHHIYFLVELTVGHCWNTLQWPLWLQYQNVVQGFSLQKCRLHPFSRVREEEEKCHVQSGWERCSELDWHNCILCNCHYATVVNLWVAIINNVKHLVDEVNWNLRTDVWGHCIIANGCGALQELFLLNFLKDEHLHNLHLPFLKVLFTGFDWEGTEETKKRMVGKA